MPFRKSKQKNKKLIYERVVQYSLPEYLSVKNDEELKILLQNKKILPIDVDTLKSILTLTYSTSGKIILTRSAFK